MSTHEPAASLTVTGKELWQPAAGLLWDSDGLRRVSCTCQLLFQAFCRLKKESLVSVINQNGFSQILITVNHYQFLCVCVLMHCLVYFFDESGLALVTYM